MQRAPDDGRSSAYRVPPDVEADARAVADDLAAGRAVDLTPAELDEWAATGELPASAAERLARACSERRG